MLKRLHFLFLLMLTVYHSDGQIKWSYLTSAEESFIIGDQSSSINLLNLSNAANNGGIRLGGIAHINDKLTLSGSIGVIGSAKLGSFATNMVPFELTGQYKLAEMDFSTNIPLTWYADASIGSSFIRAQSTNYNLGGYNSLSENFSLGASLDLIQWNGGIVAIGYRHTFFNDDNIDALNENRSFDQLSRWYTSYRIDLAGVEMQGHLLRFANGPSGWYTSVEESFIIGDRISSINPLNLSNAANNAGIRIGLYQFFSNKLWAEATLGVIGSAKLGSFSTKLVPVEIIGHYNVYSNPINAKMPMNWYADLGAGMSFVRAKSENYNTAGYNSSSANLSLGASLDLLQFQGQTLAIGYRHSIFGDDNIDALNELGGRDQLSRWFTSFRIDLSNPDQNNAQKEEAAAESVNKYLKRRQKLSDTKIEDEFSQGEQVDEKNAEKSNSAPRKKALRGVQKEDVDAEPEQGNDSRQKEKRSLSSRINRIKELNSKEYDEGIIRNIQSLEEISDDRFTDEDAIEPDVSVPVSKNIDTSATSASDNYFVHIEESEGPVTIETLTQEINRIKNEIEKLRSSKKDPINGKQIDKTDSIKFSQFVQDLDSLTVLMSKTVVDYNSTSFGKDTITESDDKTQQNYPKPGKPGVVRYAIVLKTFDSRQEAEEYMAKVSRGLGKPFIWEVKPIKKYRVVLGVYSSSYERQYKVEELRYYGYSPWITKWHD